MIAKRLISVTDVETVREKGGRILEVPQGAVVTPLARDTARRLGVSLAPARRSERPVLAYGNWKANGTLASARALAKAVRDGVGTAGSDGAAGKRRSQVALFPPLVHLSAVAEVISGSGIALGAQDLSEKGPGAFTGGVSAEMLKDLGAQAVLVGHSERRRDFGEDDALVARKLRTALAAGLEPVLCVGETQAERDAAKTHGVLRAQLLSALDGLGAAECLRITIAYEPVWAIGTGVTPTPPEAEDALSALRDHVARKYGDDTAHAARVLYGGSVTAANAARFLALPSCDGALVGGASLKAPEFLTLARAGT